MNAAAPTEPTFGALVGGRYRVHRLIARGGMSCVFEAEHMATGAKVALKMLQASLLRNEQAHARLKRETRILGAVRHPNVVVIQDAGDCEQHGPFLALEMIDGRPLDGVLLARQRLPVDQAVRILAQLCSALVSLHARGVVHRDIKPANLLICQSGGFDRAVLIDFGVAHAPLTPDGAGKLTRQGELLGTFEYMSPEQLMDSSPVDGRSDIYSAGVLLYECLTGDVPFSGGATAVITRFVKAERPSSIIDQRPDVPKGLDQVVQRALSLDRADRFDNAADFARAAIAAIADATAKGPDSPGGPPPPPRGRPPAPPPVAISPTPAAVRVAPPSVAGRRRYVRAPYVTPVRLVLAPDDNCDGRSEDISEGGVLVIAPRACATGQRVQIRFSLPASGRIVTLDAIAKWVKASRSQHALGIEFADLPAEVKAEIRAYTALMSNEGKSLS
jgi:serine/threonine protein kinase